MYNPYHHPGSSSLFHEDLQESDSLLPSELLEMPGQLLQLPQPPLRGSRGPDGQDVDAWYMPNYSIGSHLPENGYTVPVNDFNGLSLSDIPDFYPVQPQHLPYVSTNNQTLSSLGFNAYSADIGSPGWNPHSHLSSAPAAFGPDVPLTPTTTGHPQLGPYPTSPSNPRTHLQSRDRAGEYSVPSPTPRSHNRVPSQLRLSPYAQPNPQVEKRAQSTPQSSNHHNQISLPSAIKDTPQHPRSPQPKSSKSPASSSERPYECFTSSFPLQPQSGSSTSPLPIEAHLYEFPAQPSATQRPLALKVPSTTSRINRTQSKSGRSHRHCSATFAVDCSFNSGLPSTPGLVPLPKGVDASMKTKRRVDFRVGGVPGIKLTEALRENFALDNADEAVLPSESDRQIHLWISWPGYSGEDKGVYIRLQDKGDGQRISRRLFANRVATQVTKHLEKISKHPSTDAQWTLPKGKAAFDNVYMHHVSSAPSPPRYFVQLEVRIQ